MSSHIIWTRSREDWQCDQVLFKNNPYPVLHLPCVRKESLATRVVLASEWLASPKKAIIFTSPRSVQEWLSHAELKEKAWDALALGFGDKTTSLLQQQAAYFFKASMQAPGVRT